MERLRHPTLPALFALFALLAPFAAASEPPEHSWLGADGRPLPFESPDQVVGFLASSTIVEVEDLSVGITKPKKLLLERNGVRAHAIFHSIDRREQKTGALDNGRIALYLVDSYRSQIAAYEISRLLGLDSIPPTVQRKVQGRVGSVQLWIENAMTEKKRRDRELEPPDPVLWNQQKSDQWVFDNLINNIDRNTGNSLIDGDWNLWLIDHSRAFGRDRQLPYPDRITHVSTDLWKGLKALEPQAVRDRLSPYLDKSEIRAVLERRDRLVAAIDTRIARLGEDRVVRALGEPWMVVTFSDSG